MKNIYKGNLRNLSIKSLEVNNGRVSKIDFQSAVIKEDILFYRGILGAYISFDYNTRLPDYGEAREYVTQWVNGLADPSSERPHCIYTDIDEITFDRTVSKEEFKQMKKTYQQKRK